MYAKYNVFALRFGMINYYQYYYFIFQEDNLI